MKKEEYITLFNEMIRGAPIDFTNKLLPVVSEYLTENNVENSEKMLNLIVQNPNMVQQMMPQVIEYYCRKFEINNVSEISKQNNLIQKPILYYE